MRQVGVFFWGIIESISLWCLKLLFKILKRDLTNKMVEDFLQFVKFGIVGMTNTVVSYVINVLVLFALETRRVSWDYIAGNVVAFILGVLWSFYWNNKYVFQKEDGQVRNVWKALMKTYVSYAFTGLVLNNILSWIWIDICGITKYVAPIINLLLSVPINFVMNKFWAFKDEKKYIS